MQRGCCLGAAGAGFWGADARRLLRIEAPLPPRRSGGCAEGDLGSRGGRAAPVGLSGNLGGRVCGVPGPGQGHAGLWQRLGVPSLGAR